MSKIYVDTKREQVRVYNVRKQSWESCSYNEAGFTGREPMQEISDHLEDRFVVDGEPLNEVIFIMDLNPCDDTDIDGNNCEVTIQYGHLTIEKNGEDITDCFDLDGWSKEDGEYTIGD